MEYYLLIQPGGRGRKSPQPVTRTGLCFGEGAGRHGKYAKRRAIDSCNNFGTRVHNVFAFQSAASTCLVGQARSLTRLRGNLISLCRICSATHLYCEFRAEREGQKRPDEAIRANFPCLQLGQSGVKDVSCILSASGEPWIGRAMWSLVCGL